MAFAKDTPSETVEPATNTPSQHVFGNLSDEHENVWIKFMTFVGWYSRKMPSSEKLVVLKLDLSILVFGCLSFFTKYLDQQSLTNAFVRQVTHTPYKAHANLLRQWHERGNWPVGK